MREHWYPIKLTHGVERLLATVAGVPLAVPDAWIDHFRRAEAAGVFDRTREHAVFAKGDRVRVEAGPFAGLVGEVLRSEGRQRVEILLSFLHRAVPVTVAADAVNAV
jgi:transcription antitermination factor NusG